ncbi:MAG: type IV pilus secretin PilQ [Gammaproteobacteria bacterium]|nr:MAG: type IV pilus secretin PilQ [Gammaproteobacteria bacterium]
MKLLTKLSPGNRMLTKGLALVFGVLLSSAVSANELKDISVSSLSGERVQVVFELASPLNGEPNSFTIGDPARVSVDFVDTANKLDKKSLDIGVGVAQKVTTAEAGGRTRAVIYLTEQVPYTVVSKDNKVALILGTVEAAKPAVQQAVTQSKPETSTAPAKTMEKPMEKMEGPHVEYLDFRRGESGEGRVIISLSDATVPVDVRSEAGQVIVDFAETQVPAELIKRLDVMDFGTPVKTIDTGMRDGNTRIVISPSTEFYEQLAYQSDKLLTIELRPLTKDEKEEIERENAVFTGDRLTLNFQNIEVRAVLQLIADFTGMNVVVSDSVGGSLTLRLQNVPWDQALDIILKTKGLSMRQNGNVILIAPTEELASQEKLELQSQKQIEELAPLRTEFIEINYAKASDIAALLSAAGEGGDSVLSSRGSATVDARTNVIMIRDTADVLVEIRKMIAKLDVPVQQVLIESRIVIANNDFTEEIGVRFGASGAGNWNEPGEHGVVVGGTNEGVFDYGNHGIGYEVPAGSGNTGLAVDLPLNQAAGSVGLAIGKIGSYLLQLELQAMEIEGKGEVVSSPRVITSDQHTALIEQGTEIPYLEASSSGAATVSFKKAVLMLEVTPQITPNDRIIMDLTVKKDSVGEVYLNVPSIDTREVNTQVLVDNGETVVLGGIYEQDSGETKTKVPVLGDLPVVGNLFRSTQTTDDRSELLIFVTPKILKSDMKVSL